MSYKDIKASFDKEVGGSSDEAVLAHSIASSGDEAVGAEIRFRYWMLRLLFEIAGNLDSLVVSYRELVKLQKERMK